MFPILVVGRTEVHMGHMYHAVDDKFSGVRRRITAHTTIMRYESLVNEGSLGAVGGPLRFVQQAQPGGEGGGLGAAGKA
jgi:hypothetical protein